MKRELNPKTLSKGLIHLAKIDKELHFLIKLNKDLTLYERPSGFEGLVNLIVEQQLSIASAKAIFNRVKSNISPLTAEKLLMTNTVKLKEAGLSKQKINYCRGIAKAVISEELIFEDFMNKSNEEIIKDLTKFKGIGEWTAECYLLGCMGRIDAWPASDLGLQVAIKNIKGLKSRPNKLTTVKIAETWRPFRSVAALILWSSYD
tara:strand:- start:3578 stop:4189 length:612 start_codon:yes stop_codon:yes gene_type:complete